MKLYGSVTSPFVRHCRIAMLQGGLDWELYETDAAAAGAKSPAKKVPFLEDDGLMLTDSSSILKYVREKSGRDFFPDVEDYDLFCLTNTAVDSAINLFLLSNEGLGKDQSKYLGRQADRVETALDELNARVSSKDVELTDGVLRLACFLEWGLFRNRFNIDSRPGLQKVIDVANESAQFKETAIPNS